MKTLRRLTWMLGVPLLAIAQTPPPAFDVISIKPTEGQPRNSGFHRASPGVLNATNVTVRFLIEFAYDVRDDQISGGPAWLDSARYEIMAKPADDSDPKEANRLLRPRIRTLLADSFHLAVHRATKEMPVLVLTLAPKGPKGLHEAKATATDFVNNGHHLDCQHVSMAIFAKDFLARQTGRSVTDSTGLTGNYDFTLDWTPDDAAASTDAPAAPQFPPFFMALEQQLGMKLEQRRGPIEVITIDRAEKPADN